MISEKRSQSSIKTDFGPVRNREAACLYALITDRRSVSRRNRASWYLERLNKTVKCDDLDSETIGPVKESPPDEDSNRRESIESEDEDQDKDDIKLITVTSSNCPTDNSTLSSQAHGFNETQQKDEETFLVTPNTRVLFLSRSIATSIILDLSPSIVSVSPQNGCVFLDSLFDALKRVLHLLVKSHEFPSSLNSRPPLLEAKVFVSVIAYTPFVVAKNNQILVQNRRITPTNIEQVLVEIWICLNRLTQEIHELVSNTCGMSLDFSSTRSRHGAFTFAPAVANGVIRHPGIVLDDIYELGLFSSSLMPRLSRLSLIVISDGLFCSSNNLSIFRLNSIAVSFVTLGTESTHPDGCFGYTPYVDLMKFVAKTTQGFYTSHQDLIDSSVTLSKNKIVALTSNPLRKLFSWSLHSETYEEGSCPSTRAGNYQKLGTNNDDLVGINLEHVARFFCIDQPLNSLLPTNGTSDSPQIINQNYHDWRSFKQLDRNLDADFEQVLSSLLREGYLIKNIQFKHKETSRIVARLVLHWRHNLDLEQELTAPYWNNTDLFHLGDNNQPRIMKPMNTPLYGDTYCEIIVHGSYSFLHNLYCDKRTKRRSEYRDISYKQFRQLIDGVLQTHERLQYLSRFYRDSSLSKIPSFLSHGNSLLYEQPHTHRLTSTIENIVEEAKTSEFQEYWQKMSCLDTKSWKNLMHVHTLRLILEHDQPKHKNIHCQNANGRYTHVQCRRALSAITNFIKTYASFALLEDTTYIKFIYNSDADLREIETSATKGFIVIRVHKLSPTVVIHLMFTSGILDSHRVKIVSYLEEQLVHCKLRNVRTHSTGQNDNILRSKTILPSSESCCVLIKSPLERMLKVYNRNFISDYLLNNMAHGLPGSCPFSLQQSVRMSFKSSGGNDAHPGTKDNPTTTTDEYGRDSSVNRYNLVFCKYLYGVRVVQTLTNLPFDIIPSLTSNVLSKISAILVNLRIKQGFHIAFNNSGIMNLVLELTMKDPSNDDRGSSCLCQYVVFPPTVTNSSQAIHQSSILINSTGIINNDNSTLNNSTGISSKPVSLSNSLANSDGFIKNSQDTIANPILRGDDGEIKIIKEYWIEQQYGMSSKSANYHNSLENMRYPEVVDHLFMTDSSIFRYLLTYELLQLLCDKLSPYYEFDSALVRSEPKSMSPISSPTTSTNSSNIIDANNPTSPTLPSNLIEGDTRDISSKVPLLELEYRFSLVKFLELCQQASLSILLFKDKSEFFEPIVSDGHADNKCISHSRSVNPSTIGVSKRKTSVQDIDCEPTKREHRSSYQLDCFNPMPYLANSIYSPSLNHLFLDTLHKRLKQMHDKELQLTEFDLKRLPTYLRRRTFYGIRGYPGNSTNLLATDEEPFESSSDEDGDECLKAELENRSPSKLSKRKRRGPAISWRCFLRKGNQENLMIVLIPSSLDDVTKWVNYVTKGIKSIRVSDLICPLFVFRCSASMINDQVLAFVKDPASPSPSPNVMMSSPNGDVFNLEADLSLHFGQPCKYIDKLYTYNNELDTEVFPTQNFNLLSPTASDEKSLELVHFRAFLRKVKNTVLKSRFSSLNDAYLSELFIHKNDILYYINNVDLDIQKKYHVSSQLKNLAEFIKSYEDYTDSLPQTPGKSCDQLLNSILLQKCGLFVNQPITRFNEANPLMKQLHDKKLLFLMRCNYKIELLIIEESLINSKFLRKFVNPTSAAIASHAPSTSTNYPMVQYGTHYNSRYNHQQQQQQSLSNGGGSTNGSSSVLCSSSVTNGSTPPTSNPLASSLGRSDGGVRLIDMKSGSVGGNSSSPSAIFNISDRHRVSLTPRFSPSSSSVATGSYPSFANESVVLEAFRGITCPISDVDDELIKGSSNETSSIIESSSPADLIRLRHEAHMAEVLKLKGERKESHQYRRVLKSKTNYSQSHSAIDQALKRVDSLGRLEHFCLTPLLFSPSWRSKLAPVRDHTIDTPSRYNHHMSQSIESSENEPTSESTLVNDSRSRFSLSSEEQMLAREQQQREADERWHQMVCNNYIKEYEQYIQTLGFNSVQVRYPSNGSKAGTNSSSTLNANSSTIKQQTFTPTSSRRKSLTRTFTDSSASGLTNDDQYKTRTARGSIISTSTTSATSFPPLASNSYNTGYLIKFLNGGCLVFKVGFCKPYVYSILYSIEGERFNNSQAKMNMTSFLDELDNIKVTMHLHSFTYDYHLRSIYSYISGRQLTFSPGYHLISFVDDFRKYYQKAPNYARNHILSGEISISNLQVSGQQLYNYIVTHNSTYNMEVLEMNSELTGMISNLSSRAFMDKQQGKSDSDSCDAQATRSHANDYVLIELKREKIRYRDGKDLGIFDCGLLITHNVQQTGVQKNSLNLKYFLLFTNQRELYPKLVHTDDNIISLGCHRPIRLGVAPLGGPKRHLAQHHHHDHQQKQKKQQVEQQQSSIITEQQQQTHSSLTVTLAPSSRHSDQEDAQISEFQSTDEVSGPQSIISTANSIQSSNSSLQFGPPQLEPQHQLVSNGSGDHHSSSEADEYLNNSATTTPVGGALTAASQAINSPTFALPTISIDSLKVAKLSTDSTNPGEQICNQLASSIEDESGVNGGESSPASGERKRTTSASSSSKVIEPQNLANATQKEQQQQQQPQEMTICDEEITYLGYFSSEEMDMLKFLQEKTTNLKVHIEQVVRLAEVHYRRDYLWHKLMQHPSPNSPIDEMPLSEEELSQLLQIIETIDLSTLDSQLAVFTTLHIGWYTKLLEAFEDLKQSASNQHRIYTVKASKTLLLYMDPKCTAAFILLSIDPDKGSVELSMLLKDKEECGKINSDLRGKQSTKSAGHQHQSATATTTTTTTSFVSMVELDRDCKQLINDFINFCAAFMWSTLL